MKIFFDSANKEIENVMPKEIYDLIVHDVPCICEGCTGRVSYLLKQVQDGSAAICNKCKKAIIVKHIIV